MKPRGMKEAVSTPSQVAHRDQEWYDAEIARKLQEEEILATQVDVRAAQVAQDEEIARLLMAEEKKAYKKAKEREKSSLDKRKHDPDWKPKTTKSAHSKSKESDDPHRSKNDRPARPPPPTMTEAEDLDYTHFTNHNSTRHFSKSESSHKVCRDFAVLEDHTLAHSLQEQEIEHHLASNIQRNRLVQHDLQVAKQLQEEDLKAQAQLQKRYKDLEQQDCEIAQEIQEKLAIEAERQRIQEKKDEDIARLLQEKELQEEKKRKKHFPEPSGSSAYGDSYYYENGGNGGYIMIYSVLRLNHKTPL